MNYLVWKENIDAAGKVHPLYWGGINAGFWTDDRRKALLLPFDAARKLWAAGDSLGRKIHLVEAAE